MKIRIKSIEALKAKFGDMWNPNMERDWGVYAGKEYQIDRSDSVIRPQSIHVDGGLFFVDEYDIIEET